MNRLNLSSIVTLGALRDLILSFEEAEGIEKAMIGHQLIQHDGFPLLASVLSTILEDSELLSAVVPSTEDVKSQQLKVSNKKH